MVRAGECGGEGGGRGRKGEASSHPGNGAGGTGKIRRVVGMREDLETGRLVRKHRSMKRTHSKIKSLM